MISIIITAYKEHRTIAKAIDSFLNQNINNKYEIIAIAPDKETSDIIKSFSKKYKQVKYLKDPGKGKPVALNLALKHAKGDFFILTDGDVFVSKNSVKELMNKFSNSQIGAVSGRPVSLNTRDNIYGYWSHLLSDMADKLRKELISKGKFIVCSGYLYAIRKGIVDSIPDESLSDDAVISYITANKGYKISYAEKAQVFIKYPDNFKDWIKQKKRSTGGYNQLKYLNIRQDQVMRSFPKELSRFLDVFSYAKNIKELLWTFLLVLSRLYLWIVIFVQVNILKKELKKVWVRIESTK